LIGNYGINLDAVNNPNNYLTQLNFHSNLNYIQIKGYITKSSATFSGLVRDVVYWDDGSKCDFGCYITTACVKYKGFSDDCYILQTLRNFRDDHMLSSQAGKDAVKLYYETAPDLVNKIESMENAKSLFNSIYHNYLIKAVLEIESGQFKKAESTYTELYNFVKDL
jgi:hypothetical protein